MKFLTNYVIPIFLSTLIICSSITAVASPSQGTSPTLATNDRTTSGQPASLTQINNLDQSISVTPASGDVTLAPGGVYPVTVTVNTGRSGILTSDKISNPQLNVSVTDATIVEGVSSDIDYGTVTQNSGRVEFESDSAFRTKEAHSATVWVRIPENTDAGDISLTAETNTGSTTATYSVSDEQDSMAALARSAESRATVARGYQNTYHALLEYESWNETYNTAMQEALSTAAIEGTTSQVLGNTRYVGTATDVQTVYDMGSGEYQGGTAGSIARITNQLNNDLVTRIDTVPVRNAGNSSQPLDQLIALYEAEAEAWRNGNPDQAREYLQRQRAVLVRACAGNSQYSYEYDQCLAIESAAQGNRATGEDIQSYFDSLQSYSTSELEHIDRDLLPLATEPRPQVTTDEDISTVQNYLSGLDQEGDTTQVSFIVSNGENGGFTSDEGYLSFSHSDSLRVTNIENTSGDSEQPTVDVSEPSEEIATASGGTMAANHTLVDISESYEPGETNVYTVTFERTSNDTAPWLAFRTAFAPAISNVSEDNYIRYPRDSSYSTDQQGWEVQNITTGSESSIDNPPVAALSVSEPIVEVDETLEIDTSNSTDDGTLSRTVSVDTDGDGTFDDEYSSETVTTSFTQAGVAEIQLTVTDDSGQSATTTTNVTVESASTVQAEFTTNRSYITPHYTTTFTATSAADTYEWDFDGDGTTDQTGESVAYTFDSAGEQSVTLTASNSSGESDSTTTTFTVESLETSITAPTPVIEAPSTVDAGTSVTLDASESTDQQVENGDIVSGNITSYEWDLDGDGVTDQTGETVTTTFDAGGNYTVNLTLTDANQNKETAPVDIAVASNDNHTPSGGVTNWYMWGQNPRNSRYLDSSGLSGPVTTSWTLSTGFRTSITSAPAIVNGTAYFGNEKVFDEGGKIYAVNTTTGTIQWTYSTGENIYSSPAVMNGNLYIGSDTNNVYALNTTDGSVRWTSSIGSNIDRVVTTGEGVFVTTYTITEAGTSSGTLYKLNSTTGSTEWQYSSRGGLSDPAVTNNYVYTASGQNLYQININNGSLDASFNADGGLNTPVVSNSEVYVNDRSGKIYSWDTISSSLNWTYSTNDDTGTSLAVSNGTVFMGSGSGDLFAVTDGELSWSMSTSSAITTAPAVDNQMVYISSGSEIYSVDRTDGQIIWNISTGNVESFSISDKYVIYGTRSGAAGAVASEPPEANISSSSIFSTEEEAVFNATNSINGAYPIEKYEWKFGDGTTGTGENASHSYDIPGVYNVSLTITDSKGLTDQYQITVGILDGNKNELGNGTDTDPYIVRTARGLQAIQAQRTAHYELGNDIDASSTESWNNGSGFDPIGPGDREFKGTLTGSRYEINNLTIDRPNEDVGLISNLGNTGVVKNITLNNVYISGQQTGGLVGGSAGTIRNVSVDGVVVGDSRTGGVVGGNGGSIDYSSFEGNITGSDRVGGVTGTNYGTVSNSYSISNVTANGYVGGLVGYNGETISNSYAASSVSGSDNVGGITGRSFGTVSESYWDMNVSGTETSAGGIGLSTEQMINESARTNMSGLDYVNIWKIQAEDYPTLVWQTRDISDRNEPPTAKLNYTPVAPGSGDLVQFNANESTDFDGTIESYQWDLDGDGSFENSGITSSKAYDSPGNYTVTLSITDNEGAVATDTATLTISSEEEANQPPMADAGGPYSVTEGDSVRLNSSGSSDSDGNISTTSWAVVDGPGSINRSTYHAPANISSDQEAILELTVIDNDEATATDNATVLISAQTDSSSNLTVHNARLNTTSVQTGDTVEAAVNVENTGDTLGNMTVTFATNGTTRDSQSVTVANGSEVTALSTFSFRAPGEYLITIKGLQAGTVSVENETSDGGGGGTVDDGTDSGGGGGGAGGGGNGGSVSDPTTPTPPTSTDNTSANDTSPVVDVESRNESSVAVEVNVSATSETSNGTVTAAVAADVQSESGAVEAESVEIVTTATSYEGSVSVSDEVPADAPSENSIGTVEVTHTVLESEISEATFTLGVEQDTLDARDVAPRDVALYRSHDGEWTRLDTSHIGTDGNMERFQIQSPGLSTFVLGTTNDSAVAEISINNTTPAQGDSVGISAVVNNTEATEQTYTLNFSVGDTVTERTVTVAANTSTTVTHTTQLSGDKGASERDVYVNEIYAGSIDISSQPISDEQPGATTPTEQTSGMTPTGEESTTAVESPTEAAQTGTETVTTTDGPGFTMGSAMLAVVLSLLLARRAVGQ